MEIILAKQSDGRWFGRIPDSDDGNGNEMDCCLNTPEEALKCLLEQLEETQPKKKICEHKYDLDGPKQICKKCGYHDDRHACPKCATCKDSRCWCLGEGIPLLPEPKEEKCKHEWSLLAIGRELKHRCDLCGEIKEILGQGDIRYDHPEPKQENCMVETEECCILCGASNGQGSGLSNIPCKGRHIMGFCHTHKRDHSKCHEGFIKRKCCKATPMVGISIPLEPKEEKCKRGCHRCHKPAYKSIFFRDCNTLVCQDLCKEHYEEYSQPKQEKIEELDFCEKTGEFKRPYDPIYVLHEKLNELIRTFNKWTSPPTTLKN